MTLKELKTLYPEQSIYATFFYMIIGGFFSIFILCSLPFVGNNRKNIPFKNNKTSKQA
jgi:hypothetical protein|tara:strand:- start:182 stop:355 length:174 start_codon:yes stop_codon:yes gene_type:complete